MGVLLEVYYLFSSYISTIDEITTYFLIVFACCMFVIIAYASRDNWRICQISSLSFM